jgi:hypothetical protein
MGYRSDVAFAACESVLQTSIASLPEAERKLVEKFLSSADEKEEDFWTGELDEEIEYWVLYKWDDCQWSAFDDFPMDWIEIFVEENSDENSSFVRIGEALSDIETFGIGNDPFELGYERKICHN